MVNEQDLPSLRSRPYDPDHTIPTSSCCCHRPSRNGFPEDHLAYFISDIVDQIDLSEITGRYEQERGAGRPTIL